MTFCDRCDKFCEGGAIHYDAFGNDYEWPSVFNLCSYCSKEFIEYKELFFNAFRIKKTEKAMRSK